MKKPMLVAVLLAPLAAYAQAGAGPGPGPGAGPGPGPGAGMGPGVMGRNRAHGWGPEDDGKGPGEPGKRAKLALTLGLAEALDLDDAQALKLRDAVEKFHQKREPLHGQMREAMQVLRKAADGEKADAAAVDQALARLLDLRAQAQVADRELVQAVTRDQPPAKKARAVLFLTRFQHRMEERMGPMGRGGRGPSSARGPRR
jgi:Spy/CpxP family protein refolding chaperone